jgi:hypothetical protein
MAGAPNGELDAVLAAVEVRGGAEVALAGRRVPVPPAPPAGGAGGGPEVAPRIAVLRDLLYAEAYCRRLEGAAPEPVAADAGADPAFVDALARANASRERWEDGWVVQQPAPDGTVVAWKHGRTRSVPPGQYLSLDGPGAAPRAGTAIRLFVPRESRTVQPGFYYAFGEVPAEPGTGAGPLRFYWNVAAEGAADLLRAATSLLNRWQVPFQLKTLDRPGLYGRRDGSVLFVDRRFYPLAGRLAEAVSRQVAAQLDDDPPLFTRRLAPGLAFAEDPGTGESFGQLRCRLVAEAVWAAWERGETAAEARRRELDRCFREAGLSPQRPWLAARSQTDYPLPWEPAAP